MISGEILQCVGVILMILLAELLMEINGADYYVVHKVGLRSFSRNWGDYVMGTIIHSFILGVEELWFLVALEIFIAKVQLTVKLTLRG